MLRQFPLLAASHPRDKGGAPRMTLALPKEGLRAPGVEAQVGELYLADISVPPALYAEPPLTLGVGNLFAESEIIRLR